MKQEITDHDKKLINDILNATNNVKVKSALPPKTGQIPLLKIVLSTSLLLETAGIFTMGLTFTSDKVIPNYPIIITLITLIVVNIILLSYLILKKHAR